MGQLVDSIENVQRGTTSMANRLAIETIELHLHACSGAKMPVVTAKSDSSSCHIGKPPKPDERRSQTTHPNDDSACWLVG